MSNKNKHKFQGKECFSRMNFLYQASKLMAGKNNTLSSYYGELCKNIGKKSVLRIEPDIKRVFCKRCSLAQHPGITNDMHVVQRRKKRNNSTSSSIAIDDNSELMCSCNLCGHQRKFIINTNYKFWLENQSESVAEVCKQKTKTEAEAEFQNKDVAKNKAS